MQIIQSRFTHLHVFTIQYFHIRLLLRIFFYSVIEKKKRKWHDLFQRKDTVLTHLVHKALSTALRGIVGRTPVVSTSQLDRSG